jgi:pimeloyl-ACP methyl ester carboxylesterase
MAIRIPRWTGRAVLAFVGVLVLVWFGAAWLHANAIRADLMVPTDDTTPFDVVVSSNEAGRVIVTRTDQTERVGVWGLESADAYAQMGAIVSVTDETIERGVQPQVSTLVAGDLVRIDVDAYSGDPDSALGLNWEPLRSPSEIGPQPAWFVDGRRATWVVFVHGKGTDRLSESLRIMPSLVKQGFPVMAVTIRNDVGATPSESGLRYWGQEEWRDIDAAIELGVRKGAKDFVIIGSGFGASVASMFLHESDMVDLVKGVVFDSPVLDIQEVAVQYAKDHGTPGFISWLGRRLVAVRFGMDWRALDQYRRADEFDVPILLLYGAQDPVTPVDRFEAFADDRPDIVSPHRFEQGGHADLWNIDAQRYEDTIAEFLLVTAGPE